MVSFVPTLMQEYCSAVNKDSSPVEAILLEKEIFVSGDFVPR